MSAPRAPRASVIALAAVVTLGAAPRAEAGQPETTDGLKALVAQLLAAGKAGDAPRVEAIARGMVLPDHAAWFRRVFGAARAAKLAAEYERLIAQLEQDLDGMLAQVVKENRTAVRVRAIRSPDDPEANGHQQRALRAMKTRVTLYSVRLARPTDRLGGIHFYSFVHADGAFRFVGKMRALED